MFYRVDLVLFDKFETLDVFGPVEVLGALPNNFKLNFISKEGGVIESTQGVKVETCLYTKERDVKKILFVPGGMGTRDKIRDKDFINFIKEISSESEYIMSVCTGSALLAKAGILNNKRATSNKRSLKWAAEQGEDVCWAKEARWVRDNNILTSSGISAGIDMALGFVQDIIGKDKAIEICNRIEYIWNEDSTWDPFSKLYE